MAYNVKILPTAEQEVDDIVEYLMGHGINTARRFWQNIGNNSRFCRAGLPTTGSPFCGS